MNTRKQISPPLLLLLALASIPDNQPPPPPKREPDPEPDPWPRVMHPAQMEVLRDEREWLYRMGNSVGKTYRIVDPGFTREQAERAVEGLKARLSDASGQVVMLDGVEWQIGVDHAVSPPTSAFRVPDGVAAGGTATIHRRPVPNRQPLWPASQPWIPQRRVADPEKKRARKAQKRARRAGR